MICPGCNRNNAEGLDFCDYCGTPLGAAAAGKRKTEMEVGGGGGAPAHGGAPKRRTEFEAPPPGPAVTNCFSPDGATLVQPARRKRVAPNRAP